MKRLELDARIKLLATNEGGRAEPLKSGYRSLLRFDGTDTDFGFELVVVSDELNKGGLAPGEGGTVKLSFWNWGGLPYPLAGLRFELREGATIVGYGRIEDPET